MIRTLLTLSNRGAMPSRASSYAKPCLDLINTELSPSNYEEDSAVVYESFVSSQEEEILVQDIFSRMRRRRYEKGHWDAVITNYKEIELIPELLSLESQNVIEKVHTHLHQSFFANSQVPPKWLPCHAIDLQKEGKLTAHVDSVKFSGQLVAGLSLLSPSIMRLKPAVSTEIVDENDDPIQPKNHQHTTKNKCDRNNVGDSSENGKSIENAGHVDLFLPTRSLYVLSGMARYKYTHELLPSGHKFSSNKRIEINGTSNPKYDNIIVSRDQRLSIIFRDDKAS